MTFETLVRETLEGSARKVPRGDCVGPNAVMKRGRRRRRARRVIFAMLLGVVAYPAAWLPAVVTPRVVADGGETTVAIAMIPVSVSGRIAGSDIGWIGAPGPEPRFDTSELGPEVPFVPRGLQATDLEQFEEASSRRPADTVVYLGDIGREPMYIYSQQPPSIWDLIFEYVFGNWSGLIYGTSLSCCSSNGSVPDDGLPGASAWSNGDSSGASAEWLALPEEAAVVAYDVDGEPLGWQRPVGRISMLEVDPEGRDGLEMTAYDADGEVIASFSVPNLLRAAHG